MKNWSQKNKFERKNHNKSEFNIDLLRPWNYFLKKFFCKSKTWLIILFHLVFVGLFFLSTKVWFLGMQRETISSLKVNPTIQNANDFFGCVLPNLIIFPLLTLTFIISPLSWLLWELIEGIMKKTQKDGTDLFFLSTEIPTSRQQIFWRKIFSLVALLFPLHLLFFSLPLYLLLLKTSYFANFTSVQIILFLGWNFLITTLFFLAPLIIFLAFLASLNSVWYIILKILMQFSLLFYYLLYFLGGLGEKILKLINSFLIWQEDQDHYFLTTLTIIGIVIALALITARLARKNFQNKDLK